MIVRRLTGTTVLASALALAGCQLEATVRVIGEPARPVFLVTYDQGKPACVDGLGVDDVTGGDGRGQRHHVFTVVRRSSRDVASCTDWVAYGVAPAGYEVSDAPRPLVSGRLYEVSASGAGWHAARRFRR